MTTYETDTLLEPQQVVDQARGYFERVISPEGAWVEEASTSHLRLFREVGEIVIGAVRNGESTHVRASASRGAAPLARFMTTLAPLGPVVQTAHRHGSRR